MKKYLILLFSILIIIVLIFIVVIVNNDSFSNDSDRIKIVTTIFPLYDFAKTITGDKANISMLLPPGIEPHSFEPKPSDIIEINQSDIFIYTGDSMEPWAKDILDGIDNENLQVINISDGLELMRMDSVDVDIEDHEHKGIDPHVWLDFYNCQMIIDSIVN